MARIYNGAQPISLIELKKCNRAEGKGNKKLRKIFLGRKKENSNWKKKEKMCTSSFGLNRTKLPRTSTCSGPCSWICIRLSISTPLYLGRKQKCIYEGKVERVFLPLEKMENFRNTEVLTIFMLPYYAISEKK